MDDQPNSTPEFTHSSTCDPDSPSDASGMFSHSQQFTVTGGTFASITNNYTAAPGLPSDFRMIPIGDRSTAPNTGGRMHGRDVSFPKAASLCPSNIFYES
ncbi:hypothetical protein MSAN_00127400 [Mycena sanguinolenta]|uniref:Uncharacterized protein n=1 Tax=Mycena sanguinolenta TaxID=230812 RepID=A0A8H6ZDL2_9AGAR|nr:hypothetical protein MSAN_00127400 [Mycena sanguinolenta]